VGTIMGKEKRDCDSDSAMAAYHSNSSLFHVRPSFTDSSFVLAPIYFIAS
jgi:hypothetical protein